MNSQDNAEIRGLTANEIEEASGAAKLVIGPVRIKAGEDGLIFSLSIDGVGSFNIDDHGIWGNLGRQGYSFP